MLISYNKVKGKNGWLSALALPEFQIFLQVTYQLVTRMSEIQASVGLAAMDRDMTDVTAVEGSTSRA